MSLDFNRIKEIKLVDVMGRYGIPLRFKGEYAAAICPLSTHKEGDTQKSFSINLAGNYWRCFSESCNANNGGKKGGDVINFVALKEGISQLDAAKKLATWFGIADAAKPATKQEKAPPHIEKGPVAPIEKPHAKDSQNPTTSASGVKYMQEIEAWFNEMIVRGDQEDDVDYWDRIKKAVKSKLVESYRNGQKTKAA